MRLTTGKALPPICPPQLLAPGWSPASMGSPQASGQKAQYLGPPSNGCRGEWQAHQQPAGNTEAMPGNRNSLPQPPTGAHDSRSPTQAAHARGRGRWRKLAALRRTAAGYWGCVRWRPARAHLPGPRTTGAGAETLSSEAARQLPVTCAPAAGCCFWLAGFRGSLGKRTGWSRHAELKGLSHQTDYSSPRVHLQGSPGKFIFNEPCLNIQDKGFLILDSESSPGEWNGYPPQYSCLKHPMDRGAWRAAVHGITKSHSWETNTVTFTFSLGIFHQGCGRISGLLFTTHKYELKWSRKKF